MLESPMTWRTDPKIGNSLGRCSGALKSMPWSFAPRIAVGDGALDYWVALRKVFVETHGAALWVAQTAKVLNKMPKGVALPSRYRDDQLTANAHNQ